MEEKNVKGGQTWSNLELDGLSGWRDSRLGRTRYSREDLEFRRIMRAEPWLFEPQTPPLPMGV